MATTSPRVTAIKVKEVLDDHLIRHKDVYDKMLTNHEILLLGLNKNDGLVGDVRDIKHGYGTMKTIGIGILIALIANIILLAVK